LGLPQVSGLEPLDNTGRHSSNSVQPPSARRWRRRACPQIGQKDLDIAEYTDPVNNPMIPHTLVLEPGLIIFKIYNGYWFFGRPTLEELRQDLRAVTK
jgi:hypothetical protein